MTNERPRRSGAWCAAGILVSTLGLHADSLRLLVQSGYLPGLPVLVRVEILNADGSKNRDVWDADATLSGDQPRLSFSTNRIALRNGLGSALVTFSGGGDFNLTASVALLQATRGLHTVTNAPATAVGGTLVGSNTTWGGVILVTNDVTIPTGHTLTIESNTLVLISGVSSGTTAPDLIVNGTIQSLGTEEHPVTITCADPEKRWGQIRHDNAQPSIYRYTTITLAGRTAGEGHTSTGPALRPSNSRIEFEGCTISDHADASGGPGKIMLATGSDLTFVDCQLARSRMGPEISGTALHCTNSWITDMKGPDDSDGIYLHDQQAGQVITLSHCVIANGDDDAIDTLGSVITVAGCILRDWPNPNEDAKGISVFNGEVIANRCLVVNCFVGVSAKSDGPPALVHLDQCTITGLTRGIAAAYKSTATAGNILFHVTNSIVQSVDAVHTDFGATNFVIGYCDLSTNWPGVGNITGDPLFVNASTKFHLQAGSPAIDAGDPTASFDPDGTRADAGVYPFDQSGTRAPSITGQPLSQTIEEYCLATFSVLASSPTPARFQWRRDSVDLPGETNSVLTLTNVAVAEDGKRFDVVASNTAGPVISDSAILTVVSNTSPPMITVQLRDQSVAPGATVTFSVSAASGISCLHTNLNYVWTFNDSVIKGATTASLVFTNAQATDVGSYQVRVSDYRGNEAVSRVAGLALLAGPNLSGAMLSSGGSFQLGFDAGTNVNYLIRASTNLLDWQTVSTGIQVSGLVSWMDTSAIHFDRRFYRVEITP